MQVVESRDIYGAMEWYTLRINDQFQFTLQNPSETHQEKFSLLSVIKQAYEAGKRGEELSCKEFRFVIDDMIEKDTDH